MSTHRSAAALMLAQVARMLTAPVLARICYVNPERNPSEEMLICSAPDCLSCIRAHPEWPTIPLQQDDLDTLARAANKPIECDRCGEYLTAIVEGPDPRD